MPIDRRMFLSTTMVAASIGAIASGGSVAAQDYSDYTKDPRPDVAEGSWTAGGPDGPVFPENQWSLVRRLTRSASFSRFGG